MLCKFMQILQVNAGPQVNTQHGPPPRRRRGLALQLYGFGARVVFAEILKCFLDDSDPQFHEPIGARITSLFQIAKNSRSRLSRPTT